MFFPLKSTYENLVSVINILVNYVLIVSIIRSSNLAKFVRLVGQRSKGKNKIFQVKNNVQILRLLDVQIYADFMPNIDIAI